MVSLGHNELNRIKFVLFYRFKILPPKPSCGIFLWVILKMNDRSKKIFDCISTLNTWFHHQMETFFSRYWPFVRGIHRSPVNSPQKGQWCRALMFSLISAWINDWVNNLEAGDLRCHHAHHDVIVITTHLHVLVINASMSTRYKELSS